MLSTEKIPYFLYLNACMDENQKLLFSSSFKIIFWPPNLSPKINLFQKMFKLRKIFIFQNGSKMVKIGKIGPKLHFRKTLENKVCLELNFTSYI